VYRVSIDNSNPSHLANSQGREDNDNYWLNGIEINDSEKITITSSVPGGITLDGNGKKWWNQMLLGNLPPG